MIRQEAPQAAAGAHSQPIARLVECRNCHHMSAFIRTDAFTCREQCAECGNKTLLGWASCIEPFVILGQGS